MQGNRKQCRKLRDNGCQGETHCCQGKNPLLLGKPLATKENPLLLGKPIVRETPCCWGKKIDVVTMEKWQ